MNNTTEEKTIRLLRTHYFIHIAALALFFLLVLFRVLPVFSDEEAVSVVLERYAIMISIIAVPLALKLFAVKIKKIPAGIDLPTAAKKYKNAFFLRLYIVSTVTLLNILLFAFSRNTNFLWMTVVLFIVFVFCKPAFPELVDLANKPSAEIKEENSIDDELPA